MLGHTASSLSEGWLYHERVFFVAVRNHNYLYRLSFRRQLDCSSFIVVWQFFETSSSTTWRTCSSTWRMLRIELNGEGEPVWLTPHLRDPQPEGERGGAVFRNIRPLTYVFVRLFICVSLLLLIQSEAARITCSSDRPVQSSSGIVLLSVVAPSFQQLTGSVYQIWLHLTGFTHCA